MNVEGGVGVDQCTLHQEVVSIGEARHCKVLHPGNLSQGPEPRGDIILVIEQGLPTPHRRRGEEFYLGHHVVATGEEADVGLLANPDDIFLLVEVYAPNFRELFRPETRC